MCIYIFWLMVSNMNFIVHFIYGIDGMSSETHWRTPSFFKMGTLHHQPEDEWRLRSVNLSTSWITAKSHGDFWNVVLFHRIGWWENLQESPIFDGKNHGFRLRFSLKPIQWLLRRDQLDLACDQIMSGRCRVDWIKHPNTLRTHRVYSI